MGMFVFCQSSFESGMSHIDKLRRKINRGNVKYLKEAVGGKNGGLHNINIDHFYLQLKYGERCAGKADNHQETNVSRHKCVISLIVSGGTF